MIKPLVICVHSVILFLFSFLFGDGPGSVTGTFPQNAKPGSEFKAEIHVNKGSIGGFAKLQVEVPQGFTVKEGDSKNGNFTFENNIAKYIWTSAPSETEFTVTFTVITDASASGAKTIAAKYSYVNNNERQFIEMQPATVTMGEGSGDVAATTTTPPATTTTEETATPPPATTESTPVPDNTTPVTTTNPTPASSSFDTPQEPASNVACSRAITAGSNANEFNVEIHIKRPGIKGFAKFQDFIPEGYVAKPGTMLSGSAFSVADGKAKFVWVSLPAEDEMVLNYILEKTASAASGAKLEGEFSYLENDQTKKYKIPSQVIETGNSSIAAVTPVTNTPPVTENKQPSNPPTNTAPITKKEGNVAYHVQIGAFHNAIGSEVLAKKFSISESIKSEMAEGYSKFMIGDFNEYKGARDHRETVKQKGCASAFVVAYNGPKRITVQEALMITNQKWFK